MFVAHLKRGLGAGLVAGIAYGAYSVLVGAPLIALAERFETGHVHAGTATGPLAALAGDAVTFAAGVAWGLLFGAAFGLAYYFLEPALPDRAGGYALAGAGFVTVSGAPWLALPPVAPGVEHALGTDARLVVYASMMLAGALACAGAFVAYRRASSHGRAPAALAALVPLAALLAVAALAPADPTTNPAPAALTATLRGFALVGQVGLWALVAATHARLDGLTPDPAPAVEAVDPVAAD